MKLQVNTAVALQPHTFRFISERDRTTEITLEGFVVPDTEGLLFIDDRSLGGFFGADWYITHMPTRRHMCAKLDDITTRDRAVEVAQRIFREFKERGWDLHSSDARSIIAHYNRLTDDEKRALWERIGA